MSRFHRKNVYFCHKFIGMEITRDIFNNLKAWKDSKRRKPLDIGF